MAVSASMVKELREKTNAGMLDCKKALEETQGDFEAAVEWLRKKGLASAGKKAGRVAAEGLVFAKVEGATGVVVEVNSETDFVARNEGFQAFVKDMAEQVIKSGSTENLTTQKYYKNSAQTVEDALKDVIAKIGENIVFRRAQRYTAGTNGIVHTYVHGEGKIGVMIEAQASTPAAAGAADFRTAIQDVALHIAAMNPMAISSEQIPAEVVSKEKEILKAKNLEQGKKAEMIDKIVEGQIRKFLAENCLIDQPFVKNPDLRISEHLKQVGGKIGGDITIKRFVRFELGEGIEKKSTDFAAEVAEQAKGH